MGIPEKDQRYLTGRPATNELFSIFSERRHPL